MKHLKYILFFSFLFFIYNANGKEKIKADSIAFKYVDFEILTMRDIPCDEFGQAFQQYNMGCIKDQYDIGNILTKLNDLPESSYRGLNTRGQLYLYYSGKIEVICMDYFRIKIKDKYYQSNEEFYELLMQICQKTEPLSRTLDDGESIFIDIDTVYRIIDKFKCDIYSLGYNDTIKVVIDYNIDNEGNVVDLILKDYYSPKNVDKLNDLEVGEKIIDILQTHLKYPKSYLRPYKKRIHVPLIIIPDNLK